MAKVLVSVVGLFLMLGAFGGASMGQTNDGPTPEATARWLSTYSANSRDFFTVQGNALVYDTDPKCAYDSKIPLDLINPRFKITAGEQGIVSVTLTCKEGECIRKFATCDHRVNTQASSVTLSFRSDRKDAARKALIHLIKTSNGENDPFS